MNFIKKNELFLLEEIVKKNFASKYKDSVIGIFWSVLKPLLIVIILTIIFSTLFTGMVDNYPVYLLSGRCLLDFFNGSIGLGMLAIKGNKGILQRSPVPKYIFILGAIISEFINLIISIILLIGVMIVTQNPFYFTIMPLSIIPIASLLIMVTGISFMLSILCVYYTDVKHLWGVLTLVFMYASAIFYPMEIIPEPYKQYLLLNPIYWIIDQFRDFFTLGSLHDPLNIINTFLISIMIFIIGLMIYKKYEKKVIMKL